MLKTPFELMDGLRRRIASRRRALGWATGRGGARRRRLGTWRRLECGGQASIEDLVKAAVALPCEDGLETLFPAPAAASLDKLVRQQKAQARLAGTRRP